jgi:tRNA pseudouridine13 synthase
MKLKCLPDDFDVEELPTVQSAGGGDFTFYRLTKRGIGTLEALEAIRRRWNLAWDQLGYAGLKDRHARTIQYVTIRGGPRQPLRQSSFELEPLGALARPYGANQSRGNRFNIAIRDLSEHAARHAIAACESIKAEGLPNYFDDQRFGSVGFGGEFIAEAWLKGEHERALRLALAEPNPHDRPGTREEKAILRAHWGNWPEAKARLPRSHARSIVTYLVDHPADYRRAFARLNRSLRTLYFSAYQSHLWNLILARLIEDQTRPEQQHRIEFRVSRLPLFYDLDETQRSFFRQRQVPLPSSRNAMPEGAIGPIVESLLAERGLTWSDLRVRHLDDVFFSKGTRDGVFVPARLEHTSAPDDLYAGRSKLTLSFDLPRGCYATILVKRLTAFH